MIGKVLEIMFFSTIGTVLLVIPTLIVPIAVILVALFRTQHNKNNQ